MSRAEQRPSHTVSKLVNSYITTKIMEELVSAFNAKIKSKAFEQFSLLMFDEKMLSGDCSSSTGNDDMSRQRRLLHKILLENHHQSSETWAQYLEIAFKSHLSTRKLQLQRLVNKALELLEEKVMSLVFLLSLRLSSTTKQISITTPLITIVNTNQSHRSTLSGS